jgi:hypothetical protein
VWCDYLSPNHCATDTRQVASADCRGVLTHNAYPVGFDAADFEPNPDGLAQPTISAAGLSVTGGSAGCPASTQPCARVMSRIVSREIAQWAPEEQPWMLSRVHVKITGQRSSGCTTNDEVALYVAIDEVTRAGTSGPAYPVPIQMTANPAPSPVMPFVMPLTYLAGGGFEADQVYDALTWGHRGSRLRWGASFKVPTAGCTVSITRVDLGYQAMLNDDYNASDVWNGGSPPYKLRSYSSLIPLANMMYFGALETTGNGTEWSGAAWAQDLSPRGHLVAESYYDPETPQTQSIHKEWDAGEDLTAMAPKDRRIFTMDASGNFVELKPTTTGLAELVLPSAERTASELWSHNLAYDFDRNGAVDDTDAALVINWARGCQINKASTGFTAQPAADCASTTPVKRPWLLGAIDRSTPAIVGPPNMPWWLNGSMIPAALRTAYWQWAADTTRATRDTIAYIGAQDGMVHAFYAGRYNTGDDPTTAAIERRGYFYRTAAAAARDYGGRTACLSRHGTSGDNVQPLACPERFAYVPGALLPDLRNNVPGPSGKQWTFAPGTHPRAAIESSPFVEDIAHYNGTAWEFRTTLFSGIGPVAPYLFALDVSDPNNPTSLWERTYANFRGTLKAPPSSALIKAPGGDKHVIVMSSGFGWVPWDPYFIVIDAWDGTEVVANGIQANGAGGAGPQHPSYGTFGSPLLLDMNGDGYTERAYMLDTGRDPTGALFTRVVRLALRPTLGAASPDHVQVCEVFRRTGEGAFGGLAGYVCDPLDPTGPCSTPKVRLYFGTSDDPRWDDTPGSYHLYAIDDLDQEPAVVDSVHNPVCTVISAPQFKYDLDSGPPPEKSWLTPGLDMQFVYFATLKSPTDSECDFSNAMQGHVFKFALQDTTGIPAASMALAAQPVGSVRVYDSHVFLGTTSGTPTIAAPGPAGFNNLPQNVQATSKVGDVYWLEQ